VICFVILLFCFDDINLSRTVDTAETAQIRWVEGVQWISVCLGKRAGLIVDAMLDPVSQQPYRVFLVAAPSSITTT
jgi:hypothetical protein